MKRLAYNIVMLFFAGLVSVTAQQKLQKTSKSINVNKDVTIDLNTSFANIEFETWNKDIIEVEAYIESTKLSKADLEKALKEWDLTIEGYGDNVSIKTKDALSSWSWGSELGNLAHLASLESLGALENVGVVLAEMPELPEVPEMPEFPEIPEVPELPGNLLESLNFSGLPEILDLPEGVKSVNFDTDEYEERGEAYLDEWSEKYERKYGDGYGEKMKVWARNFVNSDFEEKMEKWGEDFGEDFGKKMEAWGEKFGESWGKDFEKKMEKWGEEFGEQWGDEYAKKMEAWGESLDAKLKEKYGEDYEIELKRRAERMEEKIEKKAKLFEERINRNGGLFDNNSNSKIKKTIKIKIPKDAKLKVNVRHGELKFANVSNIKADLSHSKLTANSVGGSSTSINASYTDVKVGDWLDGDLKLNYVEDAKLNSVKRLVLTSNSSNINIDTLINSALIDGSFGDLNIRNIDNSFSSLNIILENSDAVIKLPKSDYDLLFRGNRSKFNNENTNKKVIKNYPEGGSSNKTIVVNAKYSNVVMQ